MTATMIVIMAVMKVATTAAMMQAAIWDTTAKNKLARPQARFYPGLA